MADVTISQLTQGIPAGNNMVPYSNGSVTLGAPVSDLFRNSLLTVGGGINGNYVSSFTQLGQNGVFVWHDNATKSLTATGLSVAINRAEHPAAYLTNAAGNALIVDAGNVGIGTVSPVSKLHVNGTVTATGLYAPGCVIQVLQAFKSDAFVTQTLIANGGEAITGLGVTITPKSASSKILVSFSVTGNGTDNVTQIYFKLRRGSTEIGNGNVDATRPAATPVLTRAYFNNNNVACNINFQYLDAPNTTAATTYQLYVGSEGNNGTIFINRTHNQGNTVNNGPCSSSFTVMEIAG